jgi:hypothetical protein
MEASFKGDRDRIVNSEWRELRRDYAQINAPKRGKSQRIFGGWRKKLEERRGFNRFFKD